MKHVTTHKDELQYLKKIEGQIRGIQKMINEERYCVDILDQVHSVIGALRNVGNKILAKHIEGCVVRSFKGKSEKDKQKKIAEIIGLVSNSRKPS